MPQRPGWRVHLVALGVIHASPGAALIYQHATEPRDKAISEELSDQISRAVEEAAAKVTRLPASLGDV